MRKPFVRPLVWFLIFFGCHSYANIALASRLIADYWQNTRAADLVALVKIEKVGHDLCLAPLEVFKGTTNAAVLCVLLPEEAPDEKSDKRRKLDFLSIAARRWHVGEQWLVFLLSDKSAAGWKIMSAAKPVPDDVDGTVQAVRDVLYFDSLPDAQAQCLFLIKLVLSGQGHSANAARSELAHLNRPEFLEYLQPLADTLNTRQFWIHLLCDNANPKATRMLSSLLKSEAGQNLCAVMNGLGRKDGVSPEEGEAISQDIFAFLYHPDALVRKDAVFILHYRNYRPAFPRIAQLLHDPDPQVRGSALCWDWYAWPEMSAETKRTISRLLHDPDPYVRACACNTLIAIRDVSSLYPLIWRHFFDTDQGVRYAVSCDLLLEDQPMLVMFLLAWPTIAAFGAGMLFLSAFSLRRRFAVLTIGALAGVAGGVVISAGIGLWLTGSPVQDALLLTPLLFLPVGIALAVAVVRHGRWLRDNKHDGSR